MIDLPPRFLRVMVITRPVRSFQKIAWVESARVGSAGSSHSHGLERIGPGSFHASRVGSGYPDPTRPASGVTRPVQTLDILDPQTLAL